MPDNPAPEFLKRMAALERQLEALERISRALSSAGQGSDAFREILAILDAKLSLSGGAMTLAHPDGELELILPDGVNFDAEPAGCLRYRRDEDGLIGRVLDSGRPYISAKMADDPFFLPGLRKRQISYEKSLLAFICVPLALREEIVGTLSAQLSLSEGNSIADVQRLLETVASFVACELNARRAAKRKADSLEDENSKLRGALIDSFHYGSIIGSSNEMRGVFMRIRQMASADSAVMIRGESGTGKELVASAIHYNSARAGKPFIKVNCAALNENLLESELFGHERGAFTGAVAKRAGRIEEASGGSIFLDEFGEISFNMQVKLLRVIQEREFERVGGNKPIRADVRIIAATNRDLEEAVKNGSFRQDLYYRVNVFPIDLPPLRARKTDILELANHFVAKHSKRLGKSIKRISTPAINMLLTYYWPGNVRELENAIERAMLVSSDDVIHGHDLPPTLQLPETSESGPVGFLKDRVRVLERELVTDALKRNGGNINAAAKELGISGRMVRYKLDDLSIDYERLFGPKRASGRHPKT
jgi:Nif-specific regulatory protein